MLSSGRFSQREQQVIEGLARGSSVKDIALELNLSINTVKDRMKSAYTKAGVHSARELVSKVYLAPGSQEATSVPRLVLQAVDGLVHAKEESSAVDALLSAARACTGASVASLWLVTRDGAEVTIAPFDDPGMQFSTRSPFLRKVVEARSASLPKAQEAEGLSDWRLRAVLGRAPMLGVCLQFLGRRAILLAWQRERNTFEDWALSALCLLARVAEAQAGSAKAVSATTV